MGFHRGTEIERLSFGNYGTAKKCAADKRRRIEDVRILRTDSCPPCDTGCSVIGKPGVFARPSRMHCWRNLMARKFKIVVCTLVIGFCLLGAGNVAAQQEGPIHAAFRHLIAIPYALFGSLLGPGCPSGGGGRYYCAGNCQYEPVCGVLPSYQPYTATVPSARAGTAPAYVTYNLVSTTEPDSTSDEPCSFIYGPLPFSR
jgi:hypothetical protein